MSFRGQLLKAGIDSNGHDVDIFQGDLTVYGDLHFSGAFDTAALKVGTEASPVTLTDTTEKALQIYTTGAAESGTQYAAIIDHTQTGASATILEALRVNIDSEVRTGSWANAIVGRINYGTAGDSAGGMAAAICAEMNMPAKDMHNLGGGYYCFDAEINVPDGAGLMHTNTTRPVAWFNLAVWGDNAGEFDDLGFLFRTDGLSAGSGHLLSTNSHTLRVNIEGTSKYLLLSDAENAIDFTCSEDVAMDVDVTTAASSGNIEGVFDLDVTNSSAGIVNFRGLTVDLTMAYNCAGPYAAYFRTDIGDATVGGLSAALGIELVLSSVAGANGEAHGMTIDIACPSGSDVGTGSNKHSFIKFEIWTEGAQGDLDDFDDHANLFFLNGMTAGTGNLIGADSRTLRINLEGTSMYIPLLEGEGISGTAINIADGFDHGINFAADPTAGDSDNSFINIGTYDSAIAVAPTSDHMFGVMHNVTMQANVAKWYQAYYTKITTSGTTTQTSIAGHAYRMVVGSNLGAVYGVQSHVTTSGARTFTSEVSAGSFYLSVDSSATISMAGNRCNALQAVLTGGATVTAGEYSVAAIYAATNAKPECLMYIGQNSTVASTSAIKLEIDGTCTYPFEFQGTVPDGWTTGSDQMTHANSNYVLIPVYVKGAGANPLYLLAGETWS